MKKVLFLLFFGLLFSQQFAIGGTPIQIRKVQNSDEGARAQTANIAVELKETTIEITFYSDCGAANIVVETSSGAFVASAYCPSTPGYSELTISTPGSYVLTITTSDGIYQGQIIIN